MCSTQNDKWNFQSNSINYAWELPSPSALFREGKPGEYIESPSFSNNEYEDIKWRLQLYPKGLNEEVSSYVSLFVTCVPSIMHLGFTSSPPNITCVIEDTRGESDFSSCGQTCVAEGVESGNSWGFPKFIRCADIIDMIEGTAVPFSCVLECTIDILGYIFPRTMYQLQHDIGQLFESKKFSDIKLNVNNEIFHAHTNVLASRSQVFAAMFAHGMLEKAEGFVTIEDIDNKVFKEILRYIYTGQVLHLEETVFGILSAADKYHLNELMALCATYLCNHLTSDNVSDVLILADAHCSEKLKAAAITFINTHGESVIVTSGYKSLLSSYPHLIAECYQALLIHSGQVGQKKCRKKEIQVSKIATRPFSLF